MDYWAKPLVDPGGTTGAFLHFHCFCHRHWLKLPPLGLVPSICEILDPTLVGTFIKFF